MKDTDCYFFYYSSCNKGESCSFRHEPAALGCETMCIYWTKGNCSKPNCSFRHMDIKKKRSKIKCFFETKPGGCQKPNCSFMHDNVRDLPRFDDSTLNSSFSELDRKIQESISGQLKIQRQFSNNPSFVVSLQEGDSDSECQPNTYKSKSGFPSKKNRSMEMNWELEKLRKIQEEEGNIVGYCLPPDDDDYDDDEENLERYGILVHNVGEEKNGTSDNPKPFPPPPPTMKFSQAQQLSSNSDESETIENAMYSCNNYGQKSSLFEKNDEYNSIFDPHMENERFHKSFVDHFIDAKFSPQKIFENVDVRTFLESPAEIASNVPNSNAYANHSRRFARRKVTERLGSIVKHDLDQTGDQFQRELRELDVILRNSHTIPLTLNNSERNGSPMQPSSFNDHRKRQLSPISRNGNSHNKRFR